MLCLPLLKRVLSCMSADDLGVMSISLKDVVKPQRLAFKAH